MLWVHADRHGSATGGCHAELFGFSQQQRIFSGAAISVPQPANVLKRL